MKDQRILVIDDDKPSCATTKAGLEKNGFTTVLVAEGGKGGEGSEKSGEQKHSKLLAQ